jgi:hypothetical protein
VDPTRTESPSHNGDQRPPERLDASLAAEIDGLRTEKAILRERLASAERLATERERRLSDLRLALLMVPKPAADRRRASAWSDALGARQPERRPDVTSASKPPLQEIQPDLVLSEDLRNAMLGDTEQPGGGRRARLEPIAEGEPQTIHRPYWTREAERLARGDQSGVWEAFEDLPSPPWWMRLRWRLRH